MGTCGRGMVVLRAWRLRLAEIRCFFGWLLCVCNGLRGCWLASFRLGRIERVEGAFLLLFGVRDEGFGRGEPAIEMAEALFEFADQVVYSIVSVLGDQGQFF